MKNAEKNRNRINVGSLGERPHFGPKLCAGGGGIEPGENVIFGVSVRGIPVSWKHLVGPTEFLT